ncbi:ABC transporter permease [Nocardioides sp. CCNWLW239]|uniref:ABC transporter permease n=1 Tax=Nocardioides sp. CCNWLW239 TaxID=3128902 RepID=UPI003015E902
MSAVSVAPSTPLPTATKVPFGRLVMVEWRKMTDTRAGRVMLMITGGLIALVAAIILLVTALSDMAALDATTWMSALSFPVSLLVPVLAIMIVTQEWGQRTHMVTFTLEPSRLKVVFAKLLAVFVLGVVTMAVAVGVGALGTVLGAAIAGSDPTWNVTGEALAWTLATQILYLLMGFGLAMLLLNTPAALVIYYGYTLILEASIFSALYFVFDWAQSLFPWISMQVAMMPFIAPDQMQAAGLTVEDGALGIARLFTSIALWVGLPLVLGTMRVLKSELK